jgi:hypothetical protein
MRLNPSATELTTAATDAALGLLCLVLLVQLVRMPGAAPWKKAIWVSVFALLVAGSALGAAAHGLELSASLRTTMWQPLYLSLGLAVALFFVGGVGDWRGPRAGRAVLPWAIAGGVGFFAITQVIDNGFGVFIAYEAAAMIATLLIYLSLWMSRRLAGAGWVTLGIALTLVASAIQLSSLSVHIIWTFDHNGLFHLVQIVAVIVIATGLRSAMTDSPRLTSVAAS